MVGRNAHRFFYAKRTLLSFHVISYKLFQEAIAVRLRFKELYYVLVIFLVQKQRVLFTLRFNVIDVIPFLVLVHNSPFAISNL